MLQQIIFLLIVQYIVLNWLREKRKFSSTISLAQFDLDVNFIQEASNNFSSLGKVLRNDKTFIKISYNFHWLEKEHIVAQYSMNDYFR